jgi:hypothetical protein
LTNTLVIYQLTDLSSSNIDIFKQFILYIRIYTLDIGVKLFINTMNLHISYVCLSFLCIFPNKIGTLRCIIDTISRFDLRNFNVAHFRETIHLLRTEEYGYGTVCQIQFYKIHDQLAITFGYDTTLTVPLKDGEIHFTTKVS